MAMATIRGQEAMARACRLKIVIRGDRMYGRGTWQSGKNHDQHRGLGLRAAERGSLVSARPF
jgi:hypothetical protein